MNEMDVRKKMLEELMGQMDQRQVGRLAPQQPPAAPAMDPRMAGEQGNLSEADMNAMPGMGGEEDELTRRLRQASMAQ